ncbi:MAG: hypothetical protein WAT39_16465 [Planctomycetota bacterium]
MSALHWTIAVEGESDAAVVAAVLRTVGHAVGIVHICGGKGRLDAGLRGYAAAAAFSPWLVLRDLDHDADCAASLLRDLRPAGVAGVAGCVRIAVRAVEAWLLADPSAATWLGVSRATLPAEVEAVADPKRLLVELARRSRLRSIREDIVPRRTGAIGPGYVDQVRSFCGSRWDPLAAAKRSDSLKRCLRFVRSQRP